MKFSQTLKLVAATAALGMTLPAFAQEDADGWTGEGSFSAGVTTGNTETTDLGLGVDLGRDLGLWAVGVKASADYGETDGDETKNRIFLAGNLDRQITDKLFGFGQVSYEQDEFSGFESRTFVGGGLGYEIYSGDALSWVVRGGPGVKFDEVLDPVTGEVSTEDSFGASAESNYAYQFNDNVGFTNDTTVLYAETSTQIGNITALTASLTDTLSARVSFEVRHDTDPVEGFEDTDTISRVSLVYAFGK
ncbi:MAG: DUF481 domain-containing protein [Henriciella sp.]|nr:DUF481 domain-containing protein [Henriciella sp.]